MKAILSALFATVAFIASIPASAAEPQLETRSIKVNYSDLDLTKAQGVSTLQHRVSGAVRQVCDDPAFDLNEKIQQHACTRAAGRAARSDISKAIASKGHSSATFAGQSQTRFGTSIVTGKQQPWTSHTSITPR